jgi:restriction system protein
MNWESQIWPFLKVIKEGDYVTLPLKGRSSIAIGKITGPYQYRKDLGNTHHIRPVDWLIEKQRSEFDQDLLYSFGAFMTVCRIQRNRAEERISAMVVGKNPPPMPLVENNEGSTDIDAAPDLELYARDQIRDYISRKFKGHQLSELVAALLTIQGYHVRNSPEGPDGGIDIIAGGGPLGFDKPRLAVQVKSSDNQADVKVIRELQGSMKTFGADQGLFVSWGGFKSSVIKETSRLFFEIRLWDSDDLIRNIQANYDLLPETIQAELPLKKVWTLVHSED